MLRIIGLTLVLLVLFTVPAISAESLGIHGEVGFRYELTGSEYQSWVMDLHYNFTDWLTIGASEKTSTNGYGTYFDFIPAWSPTNQLYEFYLLLNIDDSISFKVSTWCNHVVSGGPASIPMEGNGMYLQGTYKF